MRSVGVIDVGSNTIKLLIAKKGEALPAEKVAFHVEETRIGEGMTGHPPVIDPDAIRRGSEAIVRLVKLADACDALCIVATSAVRDAYNKQEFVNAVEKACGHELRILSGDEEATFIGLALACDPALFGLESFSLIDLGGGSLECIQFLDHKMIAEQSLQLGSVRLASLLLSDRARPLSPADRDKIVAHVKTAWRHSKFEEKSCPSKIAVLTGGAAKHLADSLAVTQRNAGFSLCDFGEIADHLCTLSEAQRVAHYGIPASRADIFPTAMVTLEESLRFLGCDRVYFSEYNLRFGIASALLQHGGIGRSI